MGAEGDADIASFLPSTQAAAPLLAISPMRKEQTFPIARWRPRSGRTATFLQWRRDVHRLAQAFGLTIEQLSEPPPENAIPQLVKGEGVQTRTASEQARIRQKWLSINTAIYWHVEPSLDLSGPDQARDVRMLDSLVKGHLANGRHLIAWASSYANVGTLEQQTALTPLV